MFAHLKIRLRSLNANPPWRTLSTAFLSILGASWLLLELFSWTFQNLINESSKPMILMVALAVALLWALKSAIPPVRSTKTFRSKSTCVELVVGNILEESETHHVAILSSDYFDSCTSTAISVKSLKGQVISQYFAGVTGAFDAAVDVSLVARQIFGIVNSSKEHGRNRLKQYPIGTSAAVPLGTRKALLVVAAKFDDDTTKTITDASSLWSSLLALWSGASILCAREEIAVPIWGANLGNAPGNRLVLFQTLLCSFATATASQHQPPTKHLRIVIWGGDYNPDEFREMASILERFEL